ncbi:hypothetical protein ACTXIX_07145 [Glutamicibacter ardleyensis]|uniref:hypothetical protein n=1 Tax=Glutamicibacter ardleyensis TaxID=225894 RepID=UPI003FB8D693
MKTGNHSGSNDDDPGDICTLLDWLRRCGHLLFLLARTNPFAFAVFTYGGIVPRVLCASHIELGSGAQ